MPLALDVVGQILGDIAEPIVAEQARTMLHMESTLLRPERLAVLLEDLTARQTERAGAIDARIADLKKKADNTEERLRRLCKLVEDGFAEMDEQLRQRIGELQEEPKLAQGALDRALDLASVRPTLTEDKTAAFAKLMRVKLSAGDALFRKNYLRAILGSVEVHADKVQQRCAAGRSRQRKSEAE